MRITFLLIIFVFAVSCSDSSNSNSATNLNFQKMDAYSSVKLKAKENNYSISKVELDQLLSSNVITQAEYNELVALSN